MILRGLSFALLIGGTAKVAISEPASLDTVKKLAGCYAVDYSYSERLAIKEGYKLDPRVYDVTGFQTKELVKIVGESSDSVRLQHFLQAESLTGDNLFMMRHHAEIWQMQPEGRYKFIGPNNQGENRWIYENTPGNDDSWLRTITHLDDGLRYQCLGNWGAELKYPRFSCSSFAPIPGRETRDMSRKDYNSLDRQTSVTIYGDSWLEKQINTKTIFQDDRKEALAEEIGKIFSLRLPIEECSEIAQWAEARQVFWDILDEAWNHVYGQKQNYFEIKNIAGTTRGQKINKIMEETLDQLAGNPELVEVTKNRLIEIIEAHRYAM